MNIFHRDSLYFVALPSPRYPFCKPFPLSGSPLLWKPHSPLEEVTSVLKWSTSLLSLLSPGSQTHAARWITQVSVPSRLELLIASPLPFDPLNNPLSFLKTAILKACVYSLQLIDFFSRAGGGGNSQCFTPFFLVPVQNGIKYFFHSQPFKSLI